MCVVKIHAFTSIGRPPSWSGTVCVYIISLFFLGSVRKKWRLLLFIDNRPKTMFCLRTFCLYGRFVPTDVLSLRTFCLYGRFVSMDVLSLRTFCPTDVMSPAVLSRDVLSPDVLSLWTFCLRTFCLGTGVKLYFNCLCRRSPVRDGWIVAWAVFLELSASFPISFSCADWGWP